MKKHSSMRLSVSTFLNTRYPELQQLEVGTAIHTISDASQHAYLQYAYPVSPVIHKNQSVKYPDGYPAVKVRLGISFFHYENYARC
jgi:hypothetical protein